MKRDVVSTSVHRNNGIVPVLVTALMKLNFAMATKIVQMERMRKIAVSCILAYEFLKFA